MIKTDVVIIGAGPIGLFAVHQLGIKGLKSEVIDNLDKAGGQCIELYPDKPIYDIPAVPECSGKSLTDNLLEQIKPFGSNIHLNERVQEIKEEKGLWTLKTSNNKIFDINKYCKFSSVSSIKLLSMKVKNVKKPRNSVIINIKIIKIFFLINLSIIM